MLLSQNVLVNIVNGKEDFSWLSAVQIDPDTESWIQNLLLGWLLNFGVFIRVFPLYFFLFRVVPPRLFFSIHEVFLFLLAAL